MIAASEARSDRQRINLSEDYEVAYWSKKWGVRPRTIGRGRAENRAVRCHAAVAKLLDK